MSMSSRRGFALPLVLLLALTAMLSIGLMLSRHSTSHLAVERQVSIYKDHHRHMGIQELIDRWSATTRGSVRDRLGDGGLAFELQLPTGARASVYLEDAQGTALNDLRSGAGRERRYARLLLADLEQFPDAQTEEGKGRLFRPDGPARLSLHTASADVLESLARAVAPGRIGERFIRTLLTERTQAVLTMARVRGIANEARLSSEEIAGFEMMLTTEPTIWRATVRIDSRNGRQTAQGLIEISNEPSSAGRATRFLTWKDLPAEGG